MRELKDLIDRADPGIAKIREWAQGSANECMILPPSPKREQALLQTQVTTHSTLGAIVYETGGVLVDGGWLRFLGSGHPRLPRVLPEWNRGRSSGFYLVADDAAGGFFAINGGALGSDVQKMYYWPPDSLNWKPMGIGFSDFFIWALSDRLAQFYASLRWPTWREDTASISGDESVSFYPPLWTAEGSVTSSKRGKIPACEAFDSKVDLARQLER
jgi:hypothetical protein